MVLKSILIPRGRNIEPELGGLMSKFFAILVMAVLFSHLSWAQTQGQLED